MTNHFFFITDKTSQREAGGQAHVNGLRQRYATFLDAIDECTAQVLILHHFLIRIFHHHAHGHHNSGGQQEDEEEFLHGNRQEDLIEIQERTSNKDANDAK